MGKCHDCKKEFDGETYRCPQCVIKNKMRQNKLRNGRTALGLCNRCGEVREDKVYKLCRSCRKKLRMSVARYTAKKRVKDFENREIPVSILAIIKCLKKATCSSKVKLTAKVYSDFQINLELQGIKYSSEKRK